MKITREFLVGKKKKLIPAKLLIDEGTVVEYMVNQRGFTFGETIDKGLISERRSTRDTTRGTIRETIN